MAETDSDIKPEPHLGYKDSFFYTTAHEKTGLCMIFNHNDFTPTLNLNARKGTDADLLEEGFRNLKFDVVLHNNFTYNEVCYELQNVKNVDKTKYSFFVCFILTYGTADGTLYAKDVPYPVQRIYELLYADRCASFSGKPKIFFIQACPCIQQNSSESTDGARSDTFTIPTRADLLVHYSTVPGSLSWSYDIKANSWFIKALCCTINKYIGKMDLLQLLSIVNYEVSKNYQENNLKIEVPCITSTLMREIHFPVMKKNSRREADLFYEIDPLKTSKIGKVLIFSHEDYLKDKAKGERQRHSSRQGTDHDVKVLVDLFSTKLGLDVEIFKDLTKESIFKKFSEIADMHEEYGCFICCILTHGNSGKLSAYDCNYEVDDMLKFFLNKWIGKPKLFFLQACQGNEIDYGIKMIEKTSLAAIASTNVPKVLNSSFQKKSVNFKHISQPDFLMVYATVPGYFSYRSTKKGSWFVQELYEAFTTHSNKDLLQLLTTTNRQVAINKVGRFEKPEDPRNGGKQTLCLTSTLTRNLDLRRSLQQIVPS